MTTTNPFQILNKKSFNAFVNLLKVFDHNYFHHSDKRLYDKGKKQYEKINKIIQENQDFKRIFTLWEQHHSFDITESIKEQFAEIQQSLV